MELVHPRVEKYLYQLLPEEDALLKEMEAYGASLDFPMVGPLVGRFLFQLAFSIKAKYIFEMGSGFGYSAYWFAKAVPGDGKVVFTEGSPKLTEKAKNFFKKGEVEERIKVEVGNALEVIDRYPGPFDLIFIDINKEDYPVAFRKALPKLRKGGLLIADNILWFGKVMTRDRDATTEGIREFTRLIYETNGLFTTILPLRDGVSVSVKQ